MDTTKRIWHNDFNRIHDAIPESWLVTLEDGSRWIEAGHHDDPIVKRYHAHCIVGAARGWL